MFEIKINKLIKGKRSDLFTMQQAEETRCFHQQIPGYTETPLISLNALAGKLGVKAVYVKDESHRFGLNAFKVLGGAYALGKVLANKLALPISEFNFSRAGELLSNPVTFITATAGNHGTGVAWAAREMGQKAVVYMPKGSSPASITRIQNLGAECIVTDVNYDDTVRLAAGKAEKKGWMLVQDTSWDGYEEIPTWISQGYMTMAAEAKLQIENNVLDKPTHIFLQAGVGAMAGGVLGYFIDAYGAGQFRSIIAEPETADCLFKSISAGSGERVAVSGSLNSIMAGLACGEVSPVTWDILRDCGDAFISVSDNISATGMRILGNPIGDDQRVISGESGAIGIGALYMMCTSDEESIKSAKEALHITDSSVILAFSTEGDTNPDRYKKIVWEGAWPLN